MAQARHDGWLDPVGIGPSAERLYSQLLAQPTASAAQLARDTGAAPNDIARDLSMLEEHGLVTRVPETEARYAAAPPGMALDGLIGRRQESLQTLRSVLADLEERFRSTRDPMTRELVEVITGTAGISQRFRQMQRDAHTEVLNLVRSPYAVTSADNTDEYDALSRGVSYRVIYDADVLAEPGEWAEIAKFTRAGEQARAAGYLPVKLAIADRSLALVPLVSANVSIDSGALVVHPSGLLDALLALFETHWQASTPLRPSAAAGQVQLSASHPTEQELRILSLLLAGLTDTAVAGRLGISVRTVIRRTSSLMARAGVAGRMGLAYEAARRGWV